MISARQLIDEVSLYLTDQEPDYEFSHWSEQDLLNAFRLAVEIVASTQKDRFMRRSTLRLVPGTIQEAPTQCHDALRVLGQTDATGRITSFPRRSSLSGLHLSGKVGCKDCAARSDGPYSVDSWGYDETNPNVIYVEPPVPDGTTATLEITCFVPPEVDNLDSEVDLGAQLRPAVFHLMLHYAWGIDVESVPARDRSASHWQQAMQLLGADSAALRNRYAATRTPELRQGATK